MLFALPCYVFIYFCILYFLVFCLIFLVFFVSSKFFQVPGFLYRRLYLDFWGQKFIGGAVIMSVNRRTSKGNIFFCVVATRVI